MKAIRKFSTYRTGISNDLVVSASMGWSAKQPATHMEHFQALKSKHLLLKVCIDLNIYSDGEDIDPVFQCLDKRDFCIAKPDGSPFNPYSTDPQNIGHHQCFTSTVMVRLHP